MAHADRSGEHTGAREPSRAESSGDVPFVGTERHALVDELVRTFERVCDSAEPQWVSIEAPSGWGKSRIAQEFYSRLAAEFQDDGRFWPQTILGGLDALSPEERRKRVYPELIDPEAGSTPAWFWWGFGCDHRYGTPMQALRTDIVQFERVKPALEARWRQSATRLERMRRAAGAKRGEIVETVAR